MADQRSDQEAETDAVGVYPPAGHADVSRDEFQRTIRRDVYAAVVMHKPALQGVALTYGEPELQCRRRLLDMISGAE